MPAPTNAKQFLTLLERSTLVDGPTLQSSLDALRARQELPSTAPEMARLLVERHVITSFHAEQLLAGRHRGFFVGKYKILGLLGSGGMGRVYLAEHSIMKRRVALKVLPKSMSTDPGVLTRFQREARAVAALKHPNIVQAYDIDQEGDLHYIVMEYVDGVSIQEYVKRRGPLHWSHAADYVCQAADALQHASDAGLVHRDIKPGNLLVERSGTVKLLDLGLAVFHAENEGDPLTLAHEDNVLGTADYLSPEQALDSHNVDIRADIYSLGCTYYYMVTGGPPFPTGSIAQKLLWHQNKHPRKLCELLPDLPEELQAITERMMAKKPEDRLSKPAEVRSAFLPFARPVARPFEGWEFDQPATPSGNAEGAPSSLQDDPSGETRKSKRSDVDLAAAAPTTVPRPAGATPVPSTSAKPQPAPGSNKKLVAQHDAQDELPTFDAEEATVGTDASPDESIDFLNTIVESHSSKSTTKVPARAPAPKWISALRSRSAMIAAGVVILVVLAGGAFSLFLGSKNSATSTGSAAPAPAVAKQPTTPGGQTYDPATTVLVSKDAPNGFPLVDEALSVATAGQTVLIDNSKGVLGCTSLQLSPGRIEGKDGVTITGPAERATLRLLASTSGPMFVIDRTKGLVLRNLILDGNGKVGPLIDIRGPGVQGLTVENITIRNFSGPAIRVSSAAGAASQLTFRNLSVEFNDPNGIGIDFLASETASSKVSVEGAKLTGPFGIGIRIGHPVADLNVSKSTFTAGKIGLQLAAAKADYATVAVTGCTFQVERKIESTVGPQAEQSVRQSDNTP